MKHTLPAVCVVVAALLTNSVRADMPLLRDVKEAQSVGPRTEPVDPAAYQHVLYVSATARADQADGSKEHPFATPAAALESIQQESQSARYAVLVAAGEYAGANLRMKQFVDLFGGFNDDWKRDIENNATILNGGEAGPVIHAARDSRIDGFTIINGRHKGAGGGIVCNHASPVISNNVLRRNATVAPDDFPSDMIHQHGNDGGAIAVMADASPVIRNNLICQNTTGIGNGGGIYVTNHCSPQIVSNIVCANQTGLTGRGHKDGSRSSNGGGIAISNDCRPLIAGNLIAMNTTDDNSDGGGIYLEYDAHAQIRGNWIVGNFGQDDGGGMYAMKNSEPIVEYNVFAGNRNESGGSCAIRLSKEGRMRLSHNLLAANPGNTIDCVGSWLVLQNNTFVNDRPLAAVIVETESQHYAPSRITGNVFAGPKEYAPFVKTNTVTAPLLTGNAVPPGTSGAAAASGNVQVEPRFIDDSARAGVLSQSFDPVHFMTTVALKDGAFQTNELRGRVVNLGERWSVIRNNDARTLLVWGDTSGKADMVLIQGTYRQADDSPCKQLGAYAPGPTTASAKSAK